MSELTSRIAFINATVRQALCVRDYYFRRQQDEAKIIVCSECIHNNPEDTYANYDFMSTHSVILSLGSDPYLIVCTFCHNQLSIVKSANATDCLGCATIAREFLLTRNENELREIRNSDSPLAVIHSCYKYTNFPWGTPLFSPLEPRSEGIASSKNLENLPTCLKPRSALSHPW